MGRINEYWKKVSGAHEAIDPDTTETAVGIANEDPRRRLESHGLSHVGKVREGNEDHFVIASLQRSLEIRQTNLEQLQLLAPLCGPKAYLFAVADGVGGQEGGKLASGLTIRTIVEYLSETVGSYHAAPAGQEHEFLDPLGHAVQRAQEKLLATFGLPQGGPSTTLTIVLLVWPQAFIVHVGDSRAYLLRDGTLKRLTRDQTMGAYLMDEYKMSEQQVEKGGYNNVLSSAIGSPEMKPAVSQLTLQRGDVLLLCTDGLTKHVQEEAIAAVLSSASGAEAGCRELIERALTDGGRDNITVVVVNTLTS
ncbi:MAG: protein phosphatase 2C domain-containing protein [Gemmatimonadaceae bacterium]